MKKNKIFKAFVILLLLISLSGCTKVLKTKDNKAVINKETGQSMTENILCRPTDKETIKLYEENKVNIKDLPECKDMKLGGKYEGLWTTIFVRPLSYIIIKLGSLVKSSGLALIIITILIRLLLFPITKKTAMQKSPTRVK